MAQVKDSIEVLVEVIITSTHEINEKLHKSFSEKLREAYDVVWKKLNKDYLTRFIQIDVKHQAL